MSPSSLPELPESLQGELFEIVLDDRRPRDREELDAAVEALCAREPAHRDAIERHAAALRSSQGLLDKIREPLAEAPLPDSIAGYRILRLVGHGGFGTVYRAHQVEPVERDVALKVLHRQHLEDRARIRFETECQTLARMQHPGIAQIYDAGRTDEGLHYFAMEFVDGEPITEWADRQGATLEQRLALFEKVAAAVEHAHQRGVVHRDLKPTNVLVRDDGVAAQPVVIDFGIAKVMEREGAESQLTGDGGLLGTPGYMSPEQAGGALVDTRTDVYALGVLLFELLTGELPFARRSLCGGIAEVVRVVREEPPRRLSSAVRSSTASLEAIARHRSAQPSALVRTLQGDLEWIVRRALAKDPDARYPTVRELVEDLSRYGRSEPVTAREPAAWYLLRRFVARHRLGVTVAAVLLLATTALIVGLWWSLDAVERARDLAEERGAVAIQKEYAAHLAAAGAALEIGDALSARQHLSLAAPRHRGWEWVYLASQCDVSANHGWFWSRPSDACCLADGRAVVLSFDGAPVMLDADAGTWWPLPFVAAGTGAAILDEARRRMVLLRDFESIDVVGLDDWSQRVAFRRDGDRASDIRSMALHPDGRTLALSDNRRRLRLLDLEGGGLREFAVARSFAWEMAFTPDGEHLVIGTDVGGGPETEFGRVDVYRVVDGVLVTSVPIQREKVRVLTLDRSGEHVFAGAGEHLHRIHWPSGRVLQRRDVGAEFRRLLFDPVGNRVYAAAGASVSAWDGDTLEALARFPGHSQPIAGVSLAVGGGLLTVADDGSWRTWDRQPRGPARVIHAGYQVGQLAVSPDGQAFATASRDGRVSVWSAEEGHRELLRVGGLGYLRGCALTDGEVFAAGPGLWRGVYPGDALESVPVDGQPYLLSLAIDDAGRFLAGADAGRDRIMLWERSPGAPGDLRQLPSVSLPRPVSVAFEAGTGRLLALCGETEVAWIDAAQSAVVQLATLPATPATLLAGTESTWVSLADRSLRPLSRDGQLGEPIATENEVICGTASPDGGRLAVAYKDNLVAIWDRRGTELMLLDDLFKPVVNLAFANGGETLLGLSWLPGSPSYVVIWDAPRDRLPIEGIR